MPAVKRATFLDRLIRAGKLDPSLYEEVEADTLAFNQALLVVALSSLATGIGAFGRIGLRGLLSGVVAGIIGWIFWELLTYVIERDCFRADGRLRIGTSCCGPLALLRRREYPLFSATRLCLLDLSQSSHRYGYSRPMS